MSPKLNVLGEPLAPCSDAPRTGFFRDGCCNTSDEDGGNHSVCVRATAAFLEFSRARANDLSTPRPEYQFDGLKPGDQWCLCAARWTEALEASAPPMARAGAVSSGEFDGSRRRHRLAPLRSCESGGAARTAPTR